MFGAGILGVVLGVYTWKPYFEEKRRQRLIALMEESQPQKTDADATE